GTSVGAIYRAKSAFRREFTVFPFVRTCTYPFQASAVSFCPILAAPRSLRVVFKFQTISQRRGSLLYQLRPSLLPRVFMIPSCTQLLGFSIPYALKFLPNKRFEDFAKTTCNRSV
uniref:Uncharacterized protein n=1 Tax=Anopheles albimanus TaxID=7167 RepID=A0A182FWU7_ANOAL